MLTRADEFESFKLRIRQVNNYRVKNLVSGMNNGGGHSLLSVSDIREGFQIDIMLAAKFRRRGDFERKVGCWDEERGPVENTQEMLY